MLTKTPSRPSPVRKVDTGLPWRTPGRQYPGRKADSVLPSNKPRRKSRMSLRSVTLDPVIKFSRDDMNTIASGGNWLVVKDHNGVTFTRHGITAVTDPDDLDRREQSKTTNLDSISREMYSATQDLFGGGNISPEMLGMLNSRIQARIDVIRAREYPAKIGPQMLDASILRLERDPVLRDSVLVEINPDLPDPLNELTIRFRVGATTE